MAELKRVVQNELAEFPAVKKLHAPLRSATHPPALASHAVPAPSIVEQLALADTINLVSQRTESTMRRILKDGCPSTTALRAQHRLMAKSLPIAHAPNGKSVRHSFRTILLALFEHCAKFRELVDMLVGQKRPLRVLVPHDADGGQNGKNSGIVCLSVKIMHPWYPGLGLDSVCAEIPLVLVWTQMEDEAEMRAAFEPTVTELQHLRDDGLALPGSAHFLYIACRQTSDMKVTEICFGTERPDCDACDASIDDVKLDAGETREYIIKDELPDPTAIFAPIIRSRTEYPTDIVHRVKNILLTVLKPIIDEATKSSAVRNLFTRNVRNLAYIPSFAFHSTKAGKILFPNMDVHSLRKVFATL